MRGPTCVFWANLTPFSLQSGGYVTKEWVHIAVGVGTPTGCTKNSCTDNNEDCCASDNPCGGTVCDDQGDGPCGCDPCAECGDPDSGVPRGPASEQQTCSGGLEPRQSGDGMCYGPYGGEQQVRKTPSWPWSKSWAIFNLL